MNTARAVACLAPLLPLLFATPRCARAQDRDEPRPGEGEPSPLDVRVRLRLWAGVLAGQLQTPKGGRKGSTSPRRPSLDEVGLSGPALLPEVELGVGLFGHELHLSDRLVVVHGRARLGEGLISQGETFPAGAAVKAGLSMQLIRITYRPRWFEPEVGGWRFEPELGLALNTFLYTLRRPGADASVHRGYVFASPYVGLLVTKQLGAQLTLELQAGGSAFVNGVTIAEGTARLVWTPLVIDRVAFGLEAGLSAAYIRRHDGQPEEQNDPTLLMGGLTFGVRFDF